MQRLFYLFWVRETGCDAGTPLRADQLEPEIRQRVLELTGPEDAEIELRLPYLDRREWPKRGKLLAHMALERHGNAISVLPEPGAAIRHTAATLALTHPAWTGAPPPSHPDYFGVWQKISMTLQSSLRTWIAERYFQDIARFEDREKAHSMLVYQAARVCHGHAHSEFTYAFHDYPACRLTLALALKMTGRNLQTILAGVEQRLNQAGMPELARRYAPVWYQDITVAVRNKPKAFLELLGDESAFINALVDLSLDRTAAGVHSFSKTANRALRRVHGTGSEGMDLRPLGVRALELATEILSAPPDVSHA